ncbi:transcription elongation factor Spt5 [Thermogladius sp. KZ2Tp1]|uniref:transcription elongation factor Spt5 n=1 Tax=unclassified Thermogladius TaxID=2647734 RepID=UPI003D09FA1F
MSSEEAKIYAVRTTVGRELDVVLILERRIKELAEKGEDVGIASLIIPPGVRGYIFIEATKPTGIYKVISEVKHLKSSSLILVSMEEIERLIKPKPVVESIKVGDIVEIVRGPFKGMRAQVTNVDKNKNMLTVSILEASHAIPITISGEYVKPVKKGD